jgi:hypothetical protein
MYLIQLFYPLLPLLLSFNIQEDVLVLKCITNIRKNLNLKYAFEELIKLIKSTELKENKDFDKKLLLLKSLITKDFFPINVEQQYNFCVTEYKKLEEQEEEEEEEEEVEGY